MQAPISIRHARALSRACHVTRCVCVCGRGGDGAAKCARNGPEMMSKSFVLEADGAVPVQRLLHALVRLHKGGGLTRYVHRMSHAVMSHGGHSIGLQAPINIRWVWAPRCAYHTGARGAAWSRKTREKLNGHILTDVGVSRR